MSRRKWELLSVALGLCLCLALWLAYRPTGPEYNGRALSSWLEAYNPKFRGTNLAEIANADAAVQGLGTNAVPYLLELLHKKNSELYNSALRRWDVDVDPFSFPKPLAPAELGYCYATEAFSALGTADGKIAIPELIDLLRNSETYAGKSAVTILSSFGAESVPALTQVLRDGSDSAKGRALFAFRVIGGPAEPAVPEIIKFLDSPESAIACDAASVLGRAGTNNPAAAAALGKKLNDPNMMVQLYAASALRKFGAQGKAAVPYLLENLDSPWNRFDNTPTVALLLCKFAPDEADARAEQIFKKLLTHEYTVSYDNLTNILASIPRGSRLAAPLLAARLNEKRRPDEISSILLILCTVGADAKEALPTLQKIATDLQSDPNSQKRGPTPKLTDPVDGWKRLSPQANAYLAATMYAIAPEECLAQVESLLTAQFDREPKDLNYVVPVFDQWLNGRSAPVFLAMLDSSEVRVKKYGLRALGCLGPAAAEALPKIQSFIKENPQAQPEEQELRNLAVTAVKQIAPSRPHTGQ